MTDQLLAYLLDELSPAERGEIETRLAADPALQTELDRLRECLAAYGDPCRCAEDPPEDLAERTCTYVKKVGDSHDGPLVQLAGAPAFSAVRSCPGKRSRYTLSDVMVAAGVMLILASLVLPLIRDRRDAARRTNCEQNLAWLGGQLASFQHRQKDHGLPGVDPGANSAQYVVELVRRGGVNPKDLAEHLVCPDSELASAIAQGKFVVVITQGQPLRKTVGPDVAAKPGLSDGNYAYRIGYMEEGKYRSPHFTGSGDEALLADAPQVTAAGVRTINHGGRGQNVAYQDLSVRFQTGCSRVASGDHIFLNDEGRHAAGCDEDDTVLAAPGFSPLGRVVSLKPVEAGK